MKFVFFSIIAVLALVAAVLAFQASDSAVAPASNNQNNVVQDSGINVGTVDIFMARVDIPVGTIIASSMIVKQPWPENLILDNFVMGEQNGQDVIGRVARSAIAANEPLMKSKLAHPNDPGFLAANLPVGMRAITIATDMVTGIAGFIFPGDRVDVLFTHEVMKGVPVDGEVITGKPTSTEVIGSGIRVLAVNLREADPSKPSVVSPSSITLEVGDELAQKIRLAEKNGTLAFALRSIHDDNVSAIPPSGLGDLSKYSGADMMIVRGPGSSGGKITASTAAGASKNAGVPDVVYGSSPSVNSAPAENKTPVSGEDAVIGNTGSVVK
ncbi:MAG: Flp pilus assembly protein CpaB [Rickettsiales bacterium]